MFMCLSVWTSMCEVEPDTNINTETFEEYTLHGQYCYLFYINTCCKQILCDEAVRERVFKDQITENVR